MEGRIIINNYIENDPLSEENLDKTLDFLNKIRLSLPQKTIWLYTGFTWGAIWDYSHEITSKQMGISNEKWCQELSTLLDKRREIVSKCDVLVDGRYVDSERDITLKWRGSSNQRVINIQETLKQNEIMLWCD